MINPGSESRAEKKARILVAGVGNVLRQDDAFGIEVVRCLMAADDLGQPVKVIETGIAGISLVQELMDGYEVLVLVDAVRRGGEPGQIHWLELDVPDIDTSDPTTQDQFADIHYADPNRALMLAKAVKALPSRVYLLGCEVDGDGFSVGMSRAVRKALPRAVAQLKKRLKREIAKSGD